METQKFNIEIDGVEKEAEVLKVLDIDDRRYAVYSIPSDGEYSDILASEVVQDEEGNDMLIDIEDSEIKQNIFEIVNIMVS